MPPIRRQLDRARHVAQRAQRAPRKIGRVARRTRYRVLRHHGPTLSVVMPVYNVGEWVRPALESVVTQSLTDLEIIVVDDGSTDHSMSIVEEYAARDDRIRIVRKQNAGLGAARNTGTEHATGEFLAFVDSDDLVMPGAYQVMVDRLRTSGSDFVTGSFERGDENESLRPMWVRRTMGADRTGITIRQEPDLLLDITAWNKVFRRSFWDRYSFGFVEGVRYEDQVPITRAYLTARSFDVVRQQVYLWRTRLDGSSITQQKSSAVDLTDRLRSQQGCAELLRKAPENVRQSWYRKLLDYDLPNYLLAALHADDAYVGLLIERLERLREEVPPEVWQLVGFRNRALSWVLSHGRLDQAVALREWFEQNQHGLPTRLREDGVVEYVPPFDVTDEEMPSWVREAHEIDVRGLVRLVSTRWDGDELVLRGSAYLPPMAPDPATHRLTLHLVDAEHRIEVPVTRYADPFLDVLAELAWYDAAQTGFEARIDTAALARTLPRGQRSLDLEFHQEQGRYHRTGGVTLVHNIGSGGSRDPRLVGGRMVRLAGVVETGIRLLVRDTYAWTTAHEVVGPDSVELELVVPPGDPVVSVVPDSPSRGTGSPLPLRQSADGTRAHVELTALRAEDPGGATRLRVRHASGVRGPLLWHEEDNVVGTADRGGLVERGASQGVAVTAAQPAVSVRFLDVVDGVLRLAVTSLRAEGLRVRLQGPRAHSLPSAPLGEGETELEVPVAQDPWGRGTAPLNPGDYLLALVDTEGQEVSGSLKVATSCREDLPLRFDLGDQHLMLGVTHLWGLQVHVTALALDEATPRRQLVLRTQHYPAARREELLPAVLLETFSGASAGDSPAALARELARRGSSLDIAMSVNDHALEVPEGARGVVRFSEEWFTLLARARWVVNNNNFPYFFRKTPGQVYLQTWHGTPLKRIANDIADQQWFSVTYRGTMDREAAAWDHLVSPSPYCSGIFPRAFDYHGPLLELGYPRNDALLAPDRDEVRADVRRRLGIAEDARVVLYAPTWRESARSTQGYGKVLYLQAEEVAAALPGTTVIVRGHANTSTSGSVTGRGVVDATLYPEISDLFLASDVLVTDYSSVMFDYAVLDRPIILLVPDLEDYRSRLRGFYFDLEAEAPGPLCSDQAQVLRHLRDGTADSEEYRARRTRFRERFAPWDDGSASARVADVVFGDERP